jgi:glycosyltransferase involved in cell wall biosynthesis
VRNSGPAAPLLVLDQAGWTWGHQATWLPNVFRSLGNLDREFVAATSVDPSAEITRPMPWRKARRISRRKFLEARHEYQAALHWAAVSHGSRSVVDLDLGISLQRMSRPAVSPYSTITAVLHGFDFGLRHGSLPVRGRHLVELRNLKRFFDGSGTVVVHTERALRLVNAHGARAELLALPVPDQIAPKVPDNGDFALFVGRPRPVKPIGPALAACASSKHRLPLWVAGGVGESEIGQVSPTRVNVLGWVGDADLAGLMSSARAVILPYEGTYRDSGAASAVLLQAVSVGAAIVGPDWLLLQAPEGYAGLYPYERAEGEEIAASLDAAAARTEVEAHRDRVEGRRLVQARHSFDQYVSGLLRLSEAG